MMPIAKNLAVISVCLLLGACAETIKRQAHFTPVFEDRVLLSGGIRFIDSSQPADYTTPEMKHPPAAQVLRMADESVKVTWISKRRKSEKLIHSDSGLHPVQIPEEIIQESRDLDAEIPSDKPYRLDGFGPNTAFIEDFIKLGAPVKAPRTSDASSD